MSFHIILKPMDVLLEEKGLKDYDHLDNPGCSGDMVEYFNGESLMRVLRIDHSDDTALVVSENDWDMWVHESWVQEAV